MLEFLDVKIAVFLAERHEVQRGQIARRIVEEHVFRARIRGANFPACRTGVPVVDGRMELDAGISASPCRVANRFPQLSCVDRLGNLAVGTLDQIPVSAGFDRLKKLVRDPNRVVGILA